ncbi:transcriptional regulator GutM [Sporosarcina sp. FSL K6-3457]|uniref:transcriptional regulator GutM n=1 Tax=Sporosarcina sp. FSL K6-3457 TaxID=2978204 RepID=UPI0030FC8B85
MWGYLLGGFVSLWLLQIYLSTLQMKHYKATVQDMSRRDSGYLGVGVEKKKLGSGTVIILVTNTEGIVEDCRVMSGVTVFIKFKECKRFIGEHISMLQDDKWTVSLEMAVEKIKQQMGKVATA